MVLTEGATGALAVTGSVANLFSSQTTLQHYATWIFFFNLTAGDSIEITIYVEDAQASTERIYDQFIVSGVQDKPSVFIPFVPTESYRVEAETISGTNRTINWVRYES